MAVKIRYSPADLSFAALDKEDYRSLLNFSCGVETIDTFFHNQARLCSKYGYLIPYKCTFSDTGEIVGLFTLSNDVIVLEYEDKVDFPNLPAEYDEIFRQQTSFPAVNIGHLAVRADCQSKGVGRLIVAFVAETFAHFRMTGCQFITVDALNNQRAIGFYQSVLGFEFQTVSDIGKPTRRMYLDIFTERI